jgi:hypothetical protein
VLDAAGFFLVARRAFYLRRQLRVDGSHEEQLAPTLRIIYRIRIVKACGLYLGDETLPKADLVLPHPCLTCF